MKDAAAEFTVYPFRNRLVTAKLQKLHKIILGNQDNIHEILNKG